MHATPNRTANSEATPNLGVKENVITWVPLPTRTD